MKSKLLQPRSGLNQSHEAVGCQHQNIEDALGTITTHNPVKLAPDAQARVATYLRVRGLTFDHDAWDLLVKLRHRRLRLAR
jgi:hypothetical protein